MHNIKKIYLYLVSLIALFIVVFGSITLLNMALKTWVFTKADRDFYPACPIAAPIVEQNGQSVPVKGSGGCDEAEQQKIADINRTAQKQREASNAVAMIIVGSPVFYFHWRLARKES